MFSRIAAVLTLILLLCCAGYAQETKTPRPKERTEIKGVVRQHDKFRDQTIVATKPIDIGLGNKRDTFICNMIFGYVIDENKKVGPLVMVLTPGGTGIGAAMAQGLNPGMGRAYLSPDLDVIILVSGQRYKLGKVSKDFNISPSGDFNKSVTVEVPLEVLSAIGKADEWEMAVGPLETKIVKRYMNRIREKFITLEAQYNQDISKP
jgi:hypothetical protein